MRCTLQHLVAVDFQPCFLLKVSTGSSLINCFFVSQFDCFFALCDEVSKEVFFGLFHFSPISSS